MKDHPEATDPPSGNPGDPKTAGERLAIPRYGETDWYILHFVLFTTAGVITMIVYQVINPVGSPLDTIRYIVLNVGNIAGMGIAYTISLGPCIEDRRVRRPPPAATAVQVQGRKTLLMTLRRGKAVEYRQGPVKATGPAPVPGHRRCRKPSGATAHRGHILPQFFAPIRQSGPRRRRCTGVP